MCTSVRLRDRGAEPAQCQMGRNGRVLHSRLVSGCRGVARSACRVGRPISVDRRSVRLTTRLAGGHSDRAVARLRSRCWC